MKIKFCPKCKSTKIAYKPNPAQVGIGQPATHKCENCGYESIAFPEK